MRVYLLRDWYFCLPCGCPKGSTCISRMLKTHRRRVRDKFTTTLEWKNTHFCSGLNICSLLTKTCELPVSSPQDLRFACLYICLMVFKGVKYFKFLCITVTYWSKNHSASVKHVPLFIIISHLWLVGIFQSGTVLAISFYFWSLFIMVSEK